MLNKTELTASKKIKLAASSVAFQGDFGSITNLAQEYDITRNTVYNVQDETLELLKGYIEDTEDEINPLNWVPVDRRQLERTSIALKTEGINSFRSIENLIPIIYPHVKISYGKIHGIIAQAQKNAEKCNSNDDLSSISSAALDEMFSQGNPVLAGVDLDTSYIFSLMVRNSRDGTTWNEVLQKCKAQGLDLQTVVKDAAKGIAKGVKEAFPFAEQRDDCFHAVFKMGKVRYFLERKAYAAIRRIEELKSEINKAKQKKSESVRSLAQKLRRAEQRCRLLLEQHDAFEKAMLRVQEVMEIVDLESGAIRDAEWMKAEINKAAELMLSLNSKRCRKVGRYIKNRAPGLVLYARELGETLSKLESIYGEMPVVIACIIVRLVSDLSNKRRPWNKYQDQKHLAGAYAMLQDLAPSQIGEVLSDVEEAFWHRHRASSAIESFNAALRPYLYVYKRVTQEFLDLFQFYYNHKKRRSGRHKGTSAYEQMTGQTVDDDWLTLLGYPPNSLAN